MPAEGELAAEPVSGNGTSEEDSFGGGLKLISVDKHKMLQILVNLIRNAKHAFDEYVQEQKQIKNSLLSSVIARQIIGRDLFDALNLEKEVLKLGN